MIDPARSWFAVVAPFTVAPNGLPVGTPPPGWTTVPIPEKDLVPAVAVLLDQCRPNPTYRWWRAEEDPTGGIAEVDGRSVTAKPAQVFVSQTGAGAIVLPLQPGDDDSDPAAWLHLVRRATRVGRPAIDHDLEASAGIDVTIADRATAPLWSVLDSIVTAAGVSGAVFDDRAIGYSAVFAAANGDDPEVLQADLARHFLRRVQFDVPVRTSEAADADAMLELHVDSAMFASLRSTGFVGVDLSTEDRYYAETLPRELRTQYLLALLLVVTHRTSLLDLSARTSAVWNDDRRRRHRELEGLRQAQAAITASGLLTQVMESTSQDAWHQLLVRLYRLPEYQAEIIQNLSALHDAVVAESTARLDRRVTALGVLIGIPSLILGFFGLSITHVTSPGGLSVIAAVVITAASFSLAAISWGWLTGRVRRD